MGKRQEKTGTVISAGMDKTVVVRVATLIQHPLYKRTMRKINKFMAHDEGNRCQEGDLVLIKETRPLSRHKRWVVGKILMRGGKMFSPEEGMEEASAGKGK
jgi:small subunit ribosomal protein S17